MIRVLAQSHAPVLGFHVTGRLSADDYRAFMTAVESAIAAHGPVRILLWFEAFGGWDLAARWHDLLFTSRHSQSVERFALVGTWHQRWSAQLSRLFTSAEVRAFPADELGDAWAWLQENRGEIAFPLAVPATAKFPSLALSPFAA
ncbi:STAS/SEC14 domain-containing protein [Horticoccus luteus]|uniref:STAS/SEC14 domain-containing protein n=1 Tax=Horticoccus luteus TaxID=2862869 RepID=A0A8F9TU94_9BACT|nr:STAS/SEC14 domain-containing protein [Horticoccus luteus]QYM78126.1 STAS/SEC14 domain-containing protein [Horticoccus luteus]